MLSLVMDLQKIERTTHCIALFNKEGSFYGSVRAPNFGLDGRRTSLPTDVFNLCLTCDIRSF